MRWQLSSLALWCGVFAANLTVCISPGVADSQLDGLELSISNSEIQPQQDELAILPQEPTLEEHPTALAETEAAVNPPVLQAQAASPPPAGTSNPNDDRFLQPVPIPQPIAPEDQTPVLPSPSPVPSPTTPPTSDTQVPIQRIEIRGSTIFDTNDFAPITQPYEGRSLTLEELRGIADRITQLYLDRGYITSRAILVDQVITEGVVQIQVVEGSLERIDVEGNRRVNRDYIRRRIELGGRTPLSQSDLEDQLRLLRLDPLFENVEASLRAGTGLGQSILTVRVTEADALAATLNINNYSPPSVGSEQFGASVLYRSLTGLGDELSVSYARTTTGGSSLFDFGYRLPVNAMNGAVQFRVAPSDYRITDPEFDQFDIRGNADLYEVSFRQPLVRSPREELAVSIGFTYRDGETLILDELTDSSTTSVFKLGQEYVRRDVQGAWAFRSQFNIGTDLFDATEASADQADGQFVSWLGQAQRVQILNADNLLIAQADLQLTPDPLLGSQQFVIGGGPSLRGYRQNARIGDNGFRFSVENRIAIQRNESGSPTLQVAPFADVGAVWNDNNNPNSEPDQSFLAGLGVGVLWEPIPRLNVRLDLALPLVDLDDRGENAQDDGFYFSVVYQP